MAARANSQITYEEYVFLTRGPSLSYGLSIQHDTRRREWEPFQEHHSLSFMVDCVWPKRFKGRQGEATLHPEPALADTTLLAADDPRHRSLGYIRATKSVLKAIIFLPPVPCWQVGSALASGMITSMLTNGLAETRGIIRVTSASFRGADFDPFEYVG
ncbi:MAG: hypothetical protein KKE02_17735 [Alphaproteobacteria bacterium]|nr:hypothetical protein [Alphaproteobacteria bacterium]MBU1515140.1 hypothetical protein [Alphaproteobacteria bacterium]MBU2092270.1 hypothetical protein [Alphaproteobacteria bacterium]MBU2152864.1 hypothetical protein [Alphaproteobacteria bacterium]MBU2305695.1 hypothetical protein [Alphaproteobacteria bacterium]